MEITFEPIGTSSMCNKELIINCTGSVGREQWHDLLCVTSTATVSK